MAIRTTDDLLNKIKRRAFIPTAQSTFTDEELLSIATEELHSVVVPSIIKTREDYFVYKDSSSTLTGTSNPSFNIPHRAVGLQLREVSITSGGTERNIPRLDIEDRVLQNGGGSVYGFDITGNQINLWGGNTGSLNLYYYLRPGELVKSSQARAITAVDTDTNTVTCSTLLSTWTTSTTFDIVQCLPGHDYKIINLTVSSIDTGAGTVTFNETLPSSGWNAIAASDWLIQSEYSPVPQIPMEWQEYLAESVVCYIMESVGDSEGFQRAQARKEEIKNNALSVISSRVDGQSKKIVSPRNRGYYYNSHYRNY